LLRRGWKDRRNWRGRRCPVGRRSRWSGRWSGGFEL
jgi:hypothetical protein